MALLWPIILVSAHTGLAQVPKFSIDPTCRAANVSDGFKRPQGACKSDERQARATLTKRWRTYSLSERRRCTAMTESGGPPSYVGLLTCLETAKDAAKLPKSKLDEPIE